MDISINPSAEKLKELFRRNAEIADKKLDEIVEKIIDRVAKDGDEALFALSEEIDGVRPQSIVIGKDDMSKAWNSISEELRESIDQAVKNITTFHSAQLCEPIVVETEPGIECVQRQVAITNVGLYVPGGRAPLFSTVLMLAIPAKVAGCRNIVMCTPPRRDGSVSPEILAAAYRAGVDKIYSVGGAQAIAAMALGTETIPRVNKIFGPGNRFVTKAKQLLSTTTAIDMPAGPSEVMVMADETADAGFVAADLLSQAEHGPDSQSILLCTSEEFGRLAIKEVERLSKLLTRADCIESSLSKSHVIVVDSIEKMIECADMYAPEHLIVSTENATETALMISNAGSIFIGNYSPESAGDYASGTNHTLPTGGWAKSMNGVNIDSFMRRITYQTLTKEGLSRLASTITTMAEAEGLDAHAMAVKIRLEKI